MENINLSIIIVNFNAKEYIKNCLDSLFADLTSLTYEVIVVDNNSNDGSVEMLKKRYPYVKLIANTANLGFAAANNQGVHASRGRYLLLLNPDTKVLPKSIDILFKFMQTHTNIGIAAPMLLNNDLSLQRSCRDFPGLWYDFKKAFGISKYLPSHPLFGRIHIDRWDHDKTQMVNQPMGACLLVRRKALQGDDIFDTRFYMYYEEVDLCYRLRKNNWLVYFIPDAKVIHYVGRSYSQNMPRMIFYMYWSKFLFYRKHYNLLKQSALYFLTVFEMIYRIIIYSLIGLSDVKRRKEVGLRIRGYSNVLSKFVLGKLLIR